MNIIREMVARIGLDWSEGDFKAFDERWKTTGKNLEKLGTKLTLALTAPIVGLAASSVMAAAKMENLETAMGVMLQDMEKGKQFSKELADFATQNPLFNVENIGETAKQLMAVGVGVKEVIPTLSMLGDISAGLGVPLWRLSMNLGQIKAKGVLQTRELRDFQMAGLDLSDALKDVLGVSITQVNEMISKGQVTYENVIAAFQKLTSEGGRFSGMAEKMSKTISGRFSQLQERFFLFRKELGESIVKVFQVKEIIIKLNEVLTKMIDWWKQASPAVQRFILIFSGLVAVIGPALIGLGTFLKLLPFISFHLLPVLAILTALALVIDDFMAWQSGGKSLLGALLGDIKQYKKDLSDFAEWWKDFFKWFFTGSIEDPMRKLFTNTLRFLVIDFVNFIESTMKSVLPDWFVNMWMKGTGLNGVRTQMDLSTANISPMSSSAIHATVRGSVADRTITIQAPININAAGGDVTSPQFWPGFQKMVTDTLSDVASQLNAQAQ